MRSTVLAALLCTGCSLDWTVGTGPVRDASASDTRTDHETMDAEPSRDVRSSPDAPPCAELQANVESAKLAAKACTSMPDDCMSHVADACGCVVFVAEASSSTTTAYLEAIAALQHSGCPLGCGSCPTPPPTKSLCLVGEGLKTSCNP